MRFVDLRVAVSKDLTCSFGYLDLRIWATKNDLNNDMIIQNLETSESSSSCTRRKYIAVVYGISAMFESVAIRK